MLLGCVGALVLWAPAGQAVTIGPPLDNLAANVAQGCDDPGIILFVFTGRLKGRKLKPGRYNLLAKPAAAGAKIVAR